MLFRSCLSGRFCQCRALRITRLRYKQLNGYLSYLNCGINSSTKQILDSLNAVTLDEDEEVVSFDVTSLYTNVPVQEAIEHCAELLYCGKHKLPPVDKDTFIRLLQLCAFDALMLTHDRLMG